MLTDFLKTSVTIQRKADSIFSGSVSASLSYTQIEEDAFLSFSVTGTTSATFNIEGTYNDVATTEAVEIVSGIGNRGFQKFSALTAIGVSGVLSGSVKISALNSEGEPLLITSTVGTYNADKSYESERHSVGVFGEEDVVTGGAQGFKFYFESSADLEDDDVITEGLHQYRIESIVELKSLTGSDSHKEVAVSKFVAKKEFA